MGKTIRVNPEAIGRTANQLDEYSESYTSIYTQMMQLASTMGQAWEGEDNLAFVEQINGFCDDLKSMADKMKNSAQTLRTQRDNYVNRQNDNIAQVRKLTN